MNLLHDAGRTLGGVLADASRALVGHWPQMVVLFLVGWAGRMGFLWLATIVSDWNPTIAVLIVPFAPMATLLSLVLMMRVIADSLPAFADMFAGLSLGSRVRDDFTVAGQVLLPFLAVYASAGLLTQDARVFLYDSTADEWLNGSFNQIDFGRADYAEGWTLVAMVVLALALRKMITMLDLAKRYLVWAGVGVYLEVLWIMTLANALTSGFEDLQGWLVSRQVIADGLGWWDQGMTWVRSISDPVTAVVDGISGFLGSLGAVALIPVAWLGIGAAVYGHRLAGQSLHVETHEEVTQRIKQVPQPVRRVVAQAVEPVTTPVQQALTAIGKIAAAGIVPMVLFCVVFVISSSLEVVAAWGMRVLIGPGEDLRQYALAPYAIMVERGFYFVVVLALLGAAVNRVVLGQRAQEVAQDGVSSTR